MFDTQAARSSSLANVPKSIGSVNIQQSHDNQAEFKRLEEEHKLLTAAYAAAGGILTANVFIPEPVTRLGSLLAGTVTAGLVLKRIEKINAILRNARALDETFQQQEVQLFLDLPVPENGRLDLFVRFPLPPKKAIFTIALRSQGNSTIFYNEQKESLYVRARGLRRWTPDHIERLSLQEYWLRKKSP
ncbi:MAG: hypothetical protein LRZ84_05480 [Desertifilum sp.]|nr:hypothetical protein [Desertifilum sp.]